MNYSFTKNSTGLSVLSIETKEDFSILLNIREILEILQISYKFFFYVVKREDTLLDSWIEGTWGSVTNLRHLEKFLVESDYFCNVDYNVFTTTLNTNLIIEETVESFDNAL